MASPNKRRADDVLKLMMKDYKVEEINGLREFNVEFHGPKGSLYEGGVWKVHVELPDDYPFKSPSIGFSTKIFHPNVDEASGTVCLNVLNQEWSSKYDLKNVFEDFLPQFLLYPNPDDPLNIDAAILMMRDEARYEQKVKEYCEKYAKKEDDSNTVEDENSEEGSESNSGDDVAGNADQ